MGELQRRHRAAMERGLNALAARQHGVLTRRQLLNAGLGLRTIERRVERGQLHRLHQGVYSVGDRRPDRRGRWLAAVLVCGEDACLSHRSAAGLWGLTRSDRGPVEVTASSGRGRPGIVVHEGGVDPKDRTTAAGIPVTSVARTLFDLAEVVDKRQLERAFEEADRLGLLEMRRLEAVCARGHGRRALRPIRRLINEARAPTYPRSPLEDRFSVFCREHDLPPAETNVEVLDHEVDAFWPRQKLIVEADSWSFHRHRAAFEGDRARDAAMQAEGFRVIRITERRLKREPQTVAAEIRRLLDEGNQSAGRAGS
jgi:very-short-patch-repair endonuclease